MNIHCFWENDTRLMIKASGIVIGYVEEVGDEPAITILPILHKPMLTFSEIDHITDNWYNMPRPNREGIIAKSSQCNGMGKFVKIKTQGSE